MSINAAKNFCKTNCDSWSVKRARLDLQLRTTSERKKQFLELIGTSETTDITIDINDHLKDSRDDIKNNGELENSLC